MKSLITTAAALCLLIAIPTVHAGSDRGARPDDDDALEADAASRKCLEFGALSLVVQANVTDGDAEIFVTVIGQDSPLKALEIRTPRGRRIVSVATSPDTGLREFILESAEITDLRRLFDSFPEGTYQFSARSVAGDCLRGSARLSHLMAMAPVLLTPGEHQILPRERFLVRWSAVPQAVSYGVELKNVATGRKLVAELPAGTLNFLVPSAWLQTASAYLVAVGATLASGNASSSEIVVSTAGE